MSGVDIGADIGADGAGSRGHHHHTYHPAPDGTIRSSNAFGTVVIFLPFTDQQGAVESIFGSRLTLERETLNPRKTERLRGGEVPLGFVRAEPALGLYAALMAVEKEPVGRGGD